MILLILKENIQFHSTDWHIQSLNCSSEHSNIAWAFHQKFFFEVAHCASTATTPVSQLNPTGSEISPSVAYALQHCLGKNKQTNTDSALKTVMKGLLELLGRTRGSQIGEERPPTGTGWTGQKSLGRTGDKWKGSRKRRGLGVPSGGTNENNLWKKKKFFSTRKWMELV